MRVFLLTISLLLSFFSGLAQGVKLVASAPKVVAVGEQFRVTYQLNNNGSGFKSPSFTAFKVLAGPSVSSGNSTTWINGKVNRSITQTYSFIIQAQKAGRFTIPPASVTFKGKKISSNTVSLEVVNQGTNNQQNPSQATPNTDNNTFVKIISQNKTVYLGEPVSLCIKIYTKSDLVDLQNADFPEYKGFYSLKVDQPDQITLSRENYKGQIYKVGVLDKVLLYPQKTGEITISPAKIDAIIHQRVERNRRDVFADMFGGRYRTVSIPLTSNELKIKVRELPDNAPENFVGAVGQFSVDASVDKVELKTNDALSYKVKISGSGNIKLLTEPKINFPHDFDVWEPTINNKITNTTKGSKGSKTYEYVIQPRHPGNFTIPAFELAYFDLNTKRYKTVKTKSFDIVVNLGDQTQAVTSIAGVSKENVELIGEDIRFIKTTKFKLQKKRHPFFGTWEYWSFFLGGIMLFLITYLYKNKKYKERSNHVLQRNKRAKKEAVQRLKQAKVYLAKGETEHFFEDIYKTLQTYLADKFNIDLSSFNITRVEEELTVRNVDQETITELGTIVQECEIARYAPSKINTSEEEIYQRSVNLISTLENKIRNTKKA